jgi:hypothetical protein
MPRSNSGGKGGKKNMDKGRQPKRKRYIASGRMVTNAVKNLERHMTKYAKDGQDGPATEALARLKEKR